MRHFRDLGVDASLIVLKTDMEGNASHFHPKMDTREWEKWRPYVRFSVISDDFTAGVSEWLGWIYWVFLKIGHKIGRHGNPSRPLPSRVIRSELHEFAYVIGSGIAPALFARIGRRLDIFFPYSSGVEHLRGVPNRGKRRGFRWAFHLLAFPLRRNQRTGIRAARLVLCGPEPESEEVIRSIRNDYLIKFTPMVYTESKVEFTQIDSCASSRIIEAKKAVSLLLFSPIRHLWELKKNHVFIQRFANVVASLPAGSVGLLLADYGPDVRKSRELVDELGIGQFVWWLPLMGRRDVREVSKLSDIVVGQFTPGSTIWGGVGWEALEDGKPLLQQFEWTEELFVSQCGVPPPPMLRVRDPIDIEERLIWSAANPDELHEIGVAAREWSTQFQGASLAREWLELLGSGRRVERSVSPSL